MDETTKPDRQSSSVNVATKTLTMTGADGSAASYDLSKLPESVAVFLIGRGAASRLGRAEDPNAEWAKLVAGQLSTERSAKAKEPSIAHQAMALAVRDELAANRGVTKKDKEAHAALLTEAHTIVGGWDKAKKAEARQTGAVLAHTAVLRAAASPSKSLLDLAA